MNETTDCVGTATSRPAAGTFWALVAAGAGGEELDK